MRSLRYLNVILTAIAILLALQLWTSWTVGGNASVLGPTQAEAAGITNAGAQRLEMINLLKKQNQLTGDLVSMLKSGNARVRVSQMRDEDDKKR